LPDLAEAAAQHARLLLAMNRSRRAAGDRTALANRAAS